eukprot:3551359-Amphidinium_carterae.1
MTCQSAHNNGTINKHRPQPLSVPSDKLVDARVEVGPATNCSAEEDSMNSQDNHVPWHTNLTPYTTPLIVWNCLCFELCEAVVLAFMCTGDGVGAAVQSFL